MLASIDNPILLLLIFVVALAVLIKSSDFFINAAEKIGLSLGISPFIVGVTIVAAGTSLPELMSSIVSVLSDNSEIVLGNVIGSNIANITLVLGLTAVVGKTIVLEKDLSQNDMPILLGSAFLLWFLVRDIDFSLVDAVICLLGLVIFLLYTFTSKDEPYEKAVIEPPNVKTYILLVVGAVGIYFGADYAVSSVVQLSDIWGIGREVVALTLVAFGTSVPELIVSIMAARRGNPAMAVGNILGSNIFNTFVVMGIPRLFGKVKVPTDVTSFSLPLMLTATILFFVVSLSKRITRWEGFILVLFYLVFLNEMISRAS